MYRLHSWSVHHHYATRQHPAYASVTINGMHRGVFRRSWKHETHQVILQPDPRLNTNKNLVQAAIRQSANRWHIPMMMNFR